MMAAAGGSVWARRCVRWRRGGALGLVVWLQIVGLQFAAEAHVGSPNVVHDGFAGNIPVRVIIRPPGVVPGLAEIDVRVLTNGVRRVTVLPVHWRAGLEGAPPPDVCQPVAGERDLFHAALWLMATGAYSVHVVVETAQGSGTLIVPVNSIATTRLPMSPVLTGILVALGLLLFFLAVSVAGAAVRESVLEPGRPVPSARRWLGWGATLGAAVVIALAVAGGKTWWDRVDRDYRNNRMFKPVPVTATAVGDGGRQVLRLTVDDPKTGNVWGALVPDHGRLMHLFLIEESSQSTLAHLHPVRRSPGEFACALPELPAGRYRLFADVTHETGFADTLTTSLTLPAAAASSAPAGDSGGARVEPDPEDSFFVGVASPADRGMDRRCPLGGGLTMTWDEPASVAGAQPLVLRFRVVDAADQPVKLEAYLGMLSHLILIRQDGAVFTHLHPAGTISLASQQVFQIRAGAKPPKRITPAMLEQLCQPPGPDLLQQPISFPYEFPSPGRYVVWVQVKVGGVVKTGRFEVNVGGRS